MDTCLSLVSVVCCQASGPATGRFLGQRNPIERERERERGRGRESEGERERERESVCVCVCVCVIECNHYSMSRKLICFNINDSRITLLHDVKYS